MTTPHSPEQSPSESAIGAKGKVPVKLLGTTPPTGGSEAAASALGAPEAVETLTPEEQMARFEKELKENDWGHQPC